MNLIQKVLNERRSSFREKELNTLLDAWVKKQVNNNIELNIHDMAELRFSILDGDIESAYNYYKKIKEREDNSVMLNEFKQFIIRNEDNEN